MQLQIDAFGTFRNRVEEEKTETEKSFQKQKEELESKFAQAMQLNAQLQAQLRNQPREPIAEFSASLTSQNETERKLFEIQRLNNNVTLNPLRLRGFQDVKDSKENFLSQNINENSKARPEETLLMEKLKKKRRKISISP